MGICTLPVAFVHRKGAVHHSSPSGQFVVSPAPTITLPLVEAPVAYEFAPPGKRPRDCMPVFSVQRKAVGRPWLSTDHPTTTVPSSETADAAEPPVEPGKAPRS